MSNYGAPPPAGQGYGPPGQPAGSPPPTNLVWGILTTVLCCLPFGIVSIVYAAQVNSKWSAGDYQGAHESSDKAKKWAIWAAIAGLIVGVLYAAFVFFVARQAGGPQVQ